MATSAPAFDVLKTMPASHLLEAKQKELIEISSNENVHSALKRLVATNVYAAPVFDAAHSDGKKYLGFIGLSDIVKFLLHVFHQKTNISDFKQLSSGGNLLSPATLKEIETEWHNASVTSIINYSGENPFNGTSPTTPSLQLIQHIADDHVARIPLVDSEGKIVGIVSPFGIVKYFAHHTHLLGEFGHKTIKELNIATPSPLMVYSSSYAIEAFELMIKKNISGVGIYDHNTENHLLTVITIKDIKEILADFSSLLQPVDEYITTIRRQNLKAIAPSIHCNSSDTLEKVVQKLAAINMHRVFVRDEHGQTSGVLTVADIMKLFLRIH